MKKLCLLAAALVILATAMGCNNDISDKYEQDREAQKEKANKMANDEE